MKHKNTIVLYDYNFKLANGLYTGEKLCKSHAHAEKKRQEYEKKYGCKVTAEFWKKIVKVNGRTVCGW